MFGLGHLTKAQRLVLGIFVLLLVDAIWVASSELTEYIFNEKNYGKPYFATYLKTSMFILYLCGFLIWRSWRQQCRRSNLVNDSKEEGNETKIDADKLMSEPMYIPAKCTSKSSSISGTESDDSSSLGHPRSVRFSKLNEVRKLTDSQAEDAALSRMSYSAYIRVEEARFRAANKLSVKQIAKLSAVFCVVFFFGNLAYQEALKDAEVGMVHVLSSTSGLFTLVLGAIFPSSAGDRFTLSKFVAVIVSIGGVVLVSLSGNVMQPGIPLGALWALCGALLYAIYLVMIRRRTDHEDKINMPMFLGFVGFFTILFLWPGVLILHFTKAERFEWPNTMQWIFLVVNSLIGSVISELLWLWGCFLTSSLVATISLSLTIPMTMVADIAIKDVSYNWMFYAGSAPVFLSFFAVCVLSYYDSWDPVLLAVKKFFQCIFRRRLFPRLRDLDREQTESLIGINNGDRMET